MNRIAVISDVHSNLQALTAVFERIDALDVDGLYCLGDIVGYGARPVECLDLVRGRVTAAVQGNHDALIADASLRLDFNVYSLAAVAHNRALLTADRLAWLGSLPTRLRVDARTQFVHGAPGDRDRYLVFLDDLQEAAAALLEDDGPGRLLLRPHPPPGAVRRPDPGAPAAGRGPGRPRTPRPDQPRQRRPAPRRGSARGVRGVGSAAATG